SRPMAAPCSRPGKRPGRGCGTSWIPCWSRTMSERIPRSIQEYLDQLRRALHDADPALRQDALYDAEEYLRAELNGKRDRPESEVIAGIVTSYGAPEEVAEIYRQTEETVSRAMRTPGPRARRGVVGRVL